MNGDTDRERLTVVLMDIFGDAPIIGPARAVGPTGARILPVRLGSRRLIAKLGPRDRHRRQLFAAANRREIDIYQTFGLCLRGPVCHHAGHDADGLSLIVLDQAPGRTVLFDAGFSAAEAGVVVDRLADLHTAMRGVPAVMDIPHRPQPEGDLAEIWRRFQLNAMPMPDDPWFGRLAETLARGETPPIPGPLTLLHGDPQCDNIVLDGHRPPNLIDWQMGGAGAGVCDLAYLLCASLTPDLRRAIEAPLLARYAARTGDDPQAIARRYPAGIRAKLEVSLRMAVLADDNSAAQQAWRRTDLTRLTAFCADHGAAILG